MRFFAAHGTPLEEMAGTLARVLIDYPRQYETADFDTAYAIAAEVHSNAMPERQAQEVNQLTRQLLTLTSNLICH